MGVVGGGGIEAALLRGRNVQLHQVQNRSGQQAWLTPGFPTEHLAALLSAVKGRTAGASGLQFASELVTLEVPVRYQ